MKDITKSIFYQMKTGYLWKKVFFILLLFLMAVMAIDIFLDADLRTVTAALAKGDNISAFLLFVPVFSAVSVSEIFGRDFADKTINQELLNGHSRAAVFFSRAVVGIVISTVGCILLVFLPFFVFSVMGYYGDTLEISGLLLRLALFLFPVLRLGCEIIFLACILKNAYLSMAVASLLVLVEQFAAGVLTHLNPYLMSVTNMQQFFSFSGWSSYTINDLKTHMVYSSALEISFALRTVSLSTVIGGLFLYLGYLVFQKDDLR